MDKLTDKLTDKLKTQILVGESLRLNIAETLNEFIDTNKNELNKNDYIEIANFIGNIGHGIIRDKYMLLDLLLKLKSNAQCYTIDPEIKILKGNKVGIGCCTQFYICDNVYEVSKIATRYNIQMILNNLETSVFVTDLSNLFDILFSYLRDFNTFDTLIKNINTINLMYLDDLFGGFILNNRYLDLYNFNTKNVISMRGTFAGLHARGIRHKFDTSKVQTMEQMFRYANIEYLDVSSFSSSSISNVNAIDKMFDSNNIKFIKIHRKFIYTLSDNLNMDIKQVYDSLFSNCSAKVVVVED